MRKNFGVKPWMFPLPVMIIGTYDEAGNANAMNAAWGGICEANRVMLCLDAEHKTTKNIRKTGAFTISFADADHVLAADYVGLVPGSSTADKMARAGFHAVKSEFVNAPVIEELPVSLECRLVKVNEDGNIIGEIVNVGADDRVVGMDGLIDTAKVDTISYDPVHNTYRRLGETVGNAFRDGAELG